jgi:hypothetical protein
MNAWTSRIEWNILVYISSESRKQTAMDFLRKVFTYIPKGTLLQARKPRKELNQKQLYVVDKWGTINKYWWVLVAKRLSQWLYLIFIENGNDHCNSLYWLSRELRQALEYVIVHSIQYYRQRYIQSEHIYMIFIYKFNF